MPTKQSITFDDLNPEEAASLQAFMKAQRAPKRNPQEENSNLEVDDNHGTDVDIGNDSGNDRDNADRAPWIGIMIKAPPGERGRGTNAHGRQGFKNEDILEHAGITPQKWSQYMSTAHRLIDRHFDITKNWTTNSQKYVDAWKVIISEMQDHHPRFLFHDGNWLIRHIAISHLANMNRKFNKMQEDSDVEAYNSYLAMKVRRTNIPHRMRGQRINKAPVRVVPPATKRLPARKKSPTLDTAVLLADSETEGDLEPSDDEPPNKRQKKTSEPQLRPQRQNHGVVNPRNPPNRRSPRKKSTLPQ